MKAKGAVALATSLPILIGGCSLFTRYEWHHPGATAAMRDLDERACAKQAIAEAGPPPTAPIRHYPSRKEVRWYQSESCSKSCAYRRADSAADFYRDIEDRAHSHERARYHGDVLYAVRTCMTALGYRRREVAAQ